VAHYRCGQQITHIFDKQIGVNMNIPAFPAMHYDLADNEHGLTMRDYFAAKAMQGFAAMSDVDGFPSVKEMAKMSYKWADAMLKARGE
jgi:hypothetical protein